MNDNIEYIYKKYDVFEKEDNIIINNYKKMINEDIQEFKENILKDIELLINKNVEDIYEKMNNKFDLLNKELYDKSKKKL